MNRDANNVKLRTLVLSTNVKNSHVYSEIYFLLCESCFWSASRLVIKNDYDSSGNGGNGNRDNNTNTNIIPKCPLCDKEKVRSMPIANGELYSLII